MRRFLVMAAFGGIFVWCGCDELLPSRVQPEAVLDVSIKPAIGFLTYDFVGPWPPYSQGLEYAVSSPLMVQFQISNVYDEVLQESLYVSGELTVVRRNSARSVTFGFDEATLIYPSPVRGMLTLQPGDTTNVYIGWDHYVTEATPVWFDDWDSRSMKYTGNVPGLGFGFRTDTIRFEITGQLQVFRNVQPFRIQEPFEAKAIYRFFPPWGP